MPAIRIIRFDVSPKIGNFRFDETIEPDLAPMPITGLNRGCNHNKDKDCREIPRVKPLRGKKSAARTINNGAIISSVTA